MRPHRSISATHRRGRRGFSLPELLVVMGIIALLLAVLLPPLRAAREQAIATACRAQLRELGNSLQSTLNEYGFYPLWDDGGSPYRFSWVDVLLQQRELLNRNVAYCPADPRPGFINADRGRHYRVFYPGQPGVYGMDYSYGIGVPLSAGGWAWRPGFGDDQHRRFLQDHDRFPAQRVLAADANWSTIFNLSGDVLKDHHWTYPTQYDNTVEWRHPGLAANVFFQDSHVERLAYNLTAAEPINTGRAFLWYPNEPIHVGPEDFYNGNFYPNVPPVDPVTGEGFFPRELVPGWYTANSLWTVTK